MRFIETFEIMPTLDSVVSLAAAFVFGALIGVERQYRQRTAGLRTNVLVALGAAAFVDLADRVAGAQESVRVISYVVSGIGFLGAGVIMKEGANIHGLNTAATLWCSAAVGACAGADMISEGALVTGFVVAANTLLRPLADRINRIPLDDQAAEATYEVRVSAGVDAAPALRDRVVELLEAANYPVGDVESEEQGEDHVEIVATLVSTAVDPQEIDAVVAELEQEKGVRHASWESSTAA
ncbi:MgtC/SapB family protein [Methylocella sp.]|uniref:MgtC/SapB family protein n=1 Tax=Methylocella sp. TaxID=1978226 RepID=UPI00378496A1